MEISKELLSEVLEEDVRLGEYNIIDNDGVPQKYNMKITLNGTTLNYWRYYKEWDDGSTMVSCQINIYELASKLKEWAFTRGYLLSSFKRFNELNYGCVIDTQHSPNCNECGESMGIHFVLGDSEPEAIIKACEWILNEKQLQH